MVCGCGVVWCGVEWIVWCGVVWIVWCGVLLHVTWPAYMDHPHVDGGREATGTAGTGTHSPPYL